MRTPRNAALVLTVMALLAPAHSQAAVGVRAFGGYDTYAMEDWNDIRRGLFIPVGSFSRPEIGSALGIGAELGWRPSLSFTMSYERLAPRDLAEVAGRNVRLPANAILLEAEYRRRLRPHIRIGVGGGAGYYQLGDETESPGTNRNLEGNAVGAQGYALGEWELTPAGSIGLDVGYRWATVGVDKVNGVEPRFGIDLDYSGLATRLVLRYLPRRAH